jgi:syntaxin 16
LFRRCENNLKRIATQGTDKGLSPEEQSMRLNAMKGMAVKVRAQSQKFRAAQKDFLLKMKKREDFPIDIADEPNEDGSIPLDEIMEKGFTPQQMAEIERIRKEGHERETQIIQIAQSINELAQMFKELSVLIVEQGSIIDRIDYNIDQAKSHVETGLSEVKKTKEYQDSATNRSWFCMIALFLAIVICIIILAVKLKK